MNNWIYLILIAVLAILAVVMLYSRFAARSREKSYHHAPSGILFSAETISVASPGDIKPLADTGVEEETGSHPRSNSESDEELATEPPRVEREKNPESDYLEELQEAAAGLALLMRSSPMERVAPVTFAPEEDREAAAEEPGITIAVDDERDECVPEYTAACAPADESASDHFPGVHDAEEPEILPVRRILGEQVLEIVDRIDLELEALDALVAGIESSLAALGAPVHRESGEMADFKEEERVFEAA